MDNTALWLALAFVALIVPSLLTLATVLWWYVDIVDKVNKEID